MQVTVDHVPERHLATVGVLDLEIAVHGGALDPRGAAILELDIPVNE